MSPYILHCTVCENDFTTRTKWLRHLLESEHQKKARDQFSQWDDTVKECALVVFSSFPVAKFDAILQHFSSNRWTEDEGFVENDELIIVTDFVWFPERPCVGFLQFESRAKVDAQLPGNSSLEVRIDDQRYQLKKAVDYMDLEWNLLLPMKNETCHPHWVKEEDALVANDLSDRNPAPKPILPDTSSEQPDNTHILKKENIETRKDCSWETIQHQFFSIREEMAIPQPICKNGHVTARNLESVFSARYPNVRVIRFRNQYLSMQNGITEKENDMALLFLLTDSKYNTNGKVINWITEDTLNTFEEVFDSPNAINLFGGRIVTAKQRYGGVPCISNLPAFKFSILTDASILPEVQACRLLKYMMKFDGRVRPLLTLVRFWAKINAVRISRNKRKVYRPPESFHLDWLLIFFLCNKKILPTPRQIQQIPHEPLLLNGVDIGFSEDTRCPDEWRSQHADANWNACLSDVLPLLMNFFQFFDTKLLGPGFKEPIVNTRDGDILNKRVVFPKNKKSMIKKRIAYLTEDEVKIMWSHKSLNQEHQFILYVLHPLYLSSFYELDMGGSIYSNTTTIVRETIKQLEASFRKCDITERIKVIDGFHLRKMLKVVGFDPI